MSIPDLSARNSRLTCAVCGTTYRRPYEARQCETSGHPNRALDPLAVPPPVTPQPESGPVVLDEAATSDSAEVAELKTTIKILVQQLAEAQGSK